MIINIMKKDLSMMNKKILYIIGGIGALFFLLPKNTRASVSPRPVQDTTKPSLSVIAPVIPDIYADAWKSPADIQADENSYYTDSWLR